MQSFPEGLVPLPEESDHLQKKKVAVHHAPDSQTDSQPHNGTHWIRVGGGPRTQFKFYPRENKFEQCPKSRQSDRHGDPEEVSNQAYGRADEETTGNESLLWTPLVLREETPKVATKEVR